MDKRELTQNELEQFEFLNRLRASGTINMFGATSNLEFEFSISKEESRRVLLLWMNNFHEDAEAYKSLLL